MNAVKTLVGIGVLVLIIAWGKENWRGFVYPDASDLTKSIEIGDFPSLEACRGAARAKLGALKALDSGDYECGLNCKVRPEYGDLNACEETVR